MKKRMGYEVDFMNEQIVVSKAFLKAAAILGTPEYQDMMTLRSENPGFRIVLREIAKKDGKKTYRNLTYANMRAYIVTREGEKSEAANEFDRVMALSKVQAGPYAYVKTWFLKKYKDEFEAEEAASQAPELKLVK